MIERINLHAGLNKHGLDTIRFDYHTCSFIDPKEEIETCQLDYTLDIVLRKDNDRSTTPFDFTEELLLGQVKMTYYNIMLIEKKRLDLVDGILEDWLFHGDNKEWIFKSFFDPEICIYNKDWEIVLEGAKNWNLLIIDEFWLVPEWRGKGLAKYVINEICHHFWSTCRIIAIKAFPLQFAENLRFNNPLFYKIVQDSPMEMDFEKAEQKVFDSLFKAGFNRNRDTNLFYISLNNARKLIMNH